MLTDETIRKIFESERGSPGLTELPENFFEQVTDYMDKKARMSRGDSEQWTLDSIKRRLSTIFDIRERKILNSAPGTIGSGVTPKNLTPEEEEFLRDIAGRIKEYRERREVKMDNREQELSVVSIKEEVPVFVGMNMRNYGPFRPGDITTMPAENAELLIKRGSAERMDIKKDQN